MRGLLKTALLATAALGLASADPSPPSDISFPAGARRQLAEELALVHASAKPQRRTAPSGNYGPSNIQCPAIPATGGPFVGQIRNATSQNINANESAYIGRHRQAKRQDWTTWLSQEQLSSLDQALPGGVANYTSDPNRIPRVGIAVSGGGYRAMLYGGGVLNALDGRNSSAVAAGTGNLLQLADYIAGLSGGSWLTGSFAINDYPTAQALHDNVWDLTSNLIFPSQDAVTIYASILAEVQDKRSFTGTFYTGITDLWARSLARHLFNNTLNPDYGAATTWSDVRNRTNYQSAQYPFPIIIADEREPNSLAISPTSAIWEFTPEEFGTWNPEIQAFLPIDALGSDLNNGVSIADGGQCVAGWDNAGWIMGVSSTLFNAAFTNLVQSNGSSILKDAVLGVLAAIGRQYNDVALVPNPFEGYRNDTSDIASLLNLTLVDGGEDGQNVPLWPLIQPARQLDFIFALDSSADISAWPNGTSLVATSDRIKNGTFAQIPFPDIPSVNTFVNQGLNTRPTFFGCPGSAISNANTSFNRSQTPLIAYIPNYPYVGLANASTFQLEYSNVQSQGIMDNAFAVATMGSNLTAGSNISWPLCLSCGMLLRSFQRSSTPIPAACQTCYDAYCWNGERNDTVPSLAYSPPVGPPQFVTSQGNLRQAPPYTGQPAAGPQSTNSALASTSSMPTFFVLLASILASCVFLLV